jgi:hypothetical protein
VGVSAPTGVFGFMSPKPEYLDLEHDCMPCGRGAGAITSVQSCAEIIDAVMRERPETSGPRAA